MSASICGSADELVAAIEEGAGGALVAQEALSLPVIARARRSPSQPAALVGLSAHHLHAADARLRSRTERRWRRSPISAT